MSHAADATSRRPSSSTDLSSRAAPRGARREVVFEEGRRRSRRTRQAAYQLGLLGEEVVADLLRDAGWRVLAHRARTRWGELDLVVRRGDAIVFVEVKTAGSAARGTHLADLVDERARHRIRRAAIAWMSTNPASQRGVNRYRFDVFLATGDGRGGFERIEHIADAF